MNSTEHLLHCAYRRGYLDSYKWQSIPFMGAFSSVYVAARIALDSLFSKDPVPKPVLQFQATQLEISEKKHDLSVLFWNSITNVFTVGFFNAIRLQAFNPEIKKTSKQEPSDTPHLSFDFGDYEVLSTSSDYEGE